MKLHTRSLALACATLLSVAGAASVAAQDAGVAEVTAVVEAFHAALAAGDSARALAQLADDVTILESGGMEDKTHYRTGHLAADMRFAQAVPRRREAITVRIQGNVAWAWSTSITQGRMGEREINSQSAELMVLTRMDGAWKIQAIHWSSRQRR